MRACAWYARPCICAVAPPTYVTQFQADLPAALDNLRQRYPQFLPSNERVVALAQCERVTSLVEYLALYDDPIDLVLEGQLVWPTPQPLLY